MRLSLLALAVLLTNSSFAHQNLPPADLAEAHTKLSNALALQLAEPGSATTTADSPLLTQILTERQKAADLSPTDPQLLLQLARVQNALARFSSDPAQQSANRDLSQKTLRRAIALQPANPAFHFELANNDVFTLNQAYGKTPRSTQDQPQSIRISDDATRHSLASQFAATAEDAINESEKVIQLQPGNAAAKLLAALAYSLRAALAESEEAATADMRLSYERADSFRTQWGNNNGLETSIRDSLLNPNVELAGGLPRARRSPTDTSGGVIGGIIGGIPPPPPPPPPRPHAPYGPQRIGGNVAEANLSKKVQPIYPPLAKSARVQGTVEFTATIDETGHVVELQLVRGHPLLVNAAKEAILQWEYRPTLLNGKPVVVITDVILNFTLSQ